MADDSERRVHPRYRLWLPARLESSAGEELAVGHDLSQKGSLLVTDAKLEVGDHLTMVVKLPPTEDEERHIGCTILRCEHNDADPEGLWPYRIAVVFDEPNPEIDRLVHEHASLFEETQPLSDFPDDDDGIDLDEQSDSGDDDSSNDDGDSGGDGDSDDDDDDDDDDDSGDDSDDDDNGSDDAENG
jgi:hypothetical protein